MNNSKKYFYFFLGLILFSFGISFSNYSLFGGNPMAVLVCGMYNVLPLSMGTCNLIAGALEIIIGTALDRSHTTLISIIALFIGSYTIDFADLVIVASESLSIRILYMFVGIILYCLGIAMQLSANVGFGNLDIFIFGLKNKFKIKEYHTIRWIVDIGFIIIGLLLKAKASIGTVLLILFTGILIEKFKLLTDKLV